MCCVGKKFRSLLGRRKGKYKENVTFLHITHDLNGVILPHKFEKKNPQFVIELLVIPCLILVNKPLLVNWLKHMDFKFQPLCFQQVVVLVDYSSSGS